MKRIARMTMVTGLILLIVGGGGFGMAVLAFPGEVHPLGLGTIAVTALGAFCLTAGIVLWLGSQLTR